LQRLYPDYHTAVLKEFNERCLGKSTCILETGPGEWPAACQRKLGLIRKKITRPTIGYIDAVTAQAIVNDAGDVWMKPTGRGLQAS